jgi:hypothetical protein
LAAGDEWRDDEFLGSRLVVGQLRFDVGGGGRIVGGTPGASKPVDAAEPERCVGTVELSRNRRENPGHHSADGFAGR